MVASCSKNDKGKSQRKNLGTAGRWELAIGRSVSGAGNAAVARLESMDCHPEWIVILSEAKDLCTAAAAQQLQRSFVALRMTNDPRSLGNRKDFHSVPSGTFYVRGGETPPRQPPGRRCYIFPPCCGGGAVAGGVVDGCASGSASWRGAAYGTLGRCVTWPRAASSTSMPA